MWLEGIYITEKGNKLKGNMKNTKIFRLNKVIVCGFFFLIPVLLFGENNYSILDSNIEKAISLRNNFFTLLIPDTADIDITHWAEEVKIKVKEKLSTTENGISTWGIFIKGILAYVNDEPIAEELLSNSLKSAENDPATTWLLFVEFDRYNISNMIEKALIQLEKQMLITGGRVSSFISRQLLHYGFEYKKKGDKNRAAYYFTWSHRFCKDEIIPLIQKTTLFFPSQLLNSFYSLVDSWNAFTRSWKAQLHFIFYLYSFIRYSVLLFVVFIFLIFSVKYFPSVLHHPAHLYPIKLPAEMGMFLLIAVLLSVLTFGLLPLLWILAFLLKPALTKNEKSLLIAVVIIMVFSPLDSFIYDRLFNSIDPEGSIMKFYEATEEENIFKENNCILSNNEKMANNLSVQISKAFCNIKNERFSVAAHTLKKLSATHSSDIMTQNLLGIVYFLSGEIDSAATYFKNVSDKFTKDYVSKFNLARCYIVSGNIASGMELLKVSAEIEPTKVNNFIENNDLYFGNKWPKLRQIIFPECTPEYFWKKIFFTSSYVEGSYKLTWGLSFLGLPPMLSFIVFVILFLFLFLFRNVKAEQAQPKRLFECKYCGKILCRRCSAGMVCTDCANEIISPNYSDNTEKATENIGRRTLLRQRTTIGFFNAFLPITGEFLEKKKFSFKVIFLVLITSFNYAFWFSIFPNLSFYWLNLKEILLITSIPFLLVFLFLVKYLPSFINNFIKLIHITFTKER